VNGMDEIKKIKFYDTNILLQNLDYIRKQTDRFYISSITLDELENIKTSANKDQEIKYNARQVVRFLNENQDKYEVIIVEQTHYELVESLNLPITHDNLIIACAKTLDNQVVFTTNDILCNLIARDYFKLETNKIKNSCINIQEEYKGYREIELNTDEINDLYIKYENNENYLELLHNEYLVIHNIDLDEIYEYKYRSQQLESIKLPPSRIVKGQNVHQRLALDLLLDKDIPIKIICGTYGSGKSLLATKMGLYHVKEKGNYSKLMIIREPIGEGSEVGYLKGTKEDKTKDFFKCVVQHLDGGEWEAESMIQNGQLVKEIPYYLKGLSIADSYIIVDEAEDLNLKMLKLIGTRIEGTSCVVFTGDWKQANDKYVKDNGLRIMIEKLKGNPLVGIIVLDEDVRSSASKVFTMLD